MIDAILYVNFSPEMSYSGFRTSLVTAVKYFAYINFGCVDLSGLQVDIVGDGADIGKKYHKTCIQNTD